jgi:hypothetical protein
MLTSEYRILSIEYFPTNFHTVSISIERVIREDGAIISSQQVDTRAFVCNELAILKEWLASKLELTQEAVDAIELVIMLEAAWSSELIANYELAQAELT